MNTYAYPPASDASAARQTARETTIDRVMAASRWEVTRNALRRLRTGARPLGWEDVPAELLYRDARQTFFAASAAYRTATA